MFSENLRAARKAKGLTQDELAIRLNVVRQTISKWEKALSVPDAELLIRIAEILDVSVSKLLGAKIKDETDQNDMAEQLARISEQLAASNHRKKKTLKTIIVVIIVILAVNILLMVSGVFTFNSFNSNQNTVETQSEFSAPRDSE